jgi:aspartate/methionine/tyrosine aminotransferase
LYPGATTENILVTNGSAEANFVIIWSTAERDADIVMMVPNYMQIWGAAQGLGTTVKAFSLCEERGRWVPDLDRLRATVTRKTRLIAICNPNNPTGSVLREEDIDTICSVASKVGAWVLADEVYRGAERVGDMTSSFWGRYDRALVVGGLSKAYGLAGLRLGWVAGPTSKIAEMWPYKDYTTIAPSVLSDSLAQIALEPAMHARILERTRRILQSQFPIVDRWLSRHRDIFVFVPPQAGAIVYPRYNIAINSTDLADRLRKEKSVLLVPGDHFGMDHFLRIGFGGDATDLEHGLASVSELLIDVIPAV